MTLPTQKPIPSSSITDQLFNAEKIDQVVNSDELEYSDRFGKKRFTFSGLYNVVQNWISSLGSSSGASAVGLSQGGTVQAGLYNVVNVEQFAYLNISDDDWGPAFRGARDKAIEISAPAVTFKGHYKIKVSSGPTTHTLPFDDGTYDTRRTGEVLLSPETLNTMPVGLEWPSGLSLKSEGIGNNSITFDWDNTTVGLSQGIGICIRVRNWDGTYLAKAGSVNRMNSDIANVEFDGFSVNNAFIGILADGIVGSVSWGSLQFKKCFLPMTWQGADRCTIKKLRFTDCPTGFSVGGWWLTRNDISGSNTGLGVPPYVAGTDVYCIGWMDFVKIESLEYSNSTSFDNSPLFAAVDTFFDTYFYKSANSARTASGGRCTNTGPNLTSASTLAADSPFLGIAGRAHSQMGRYHRNHILNEIISLKTWGCFRASVLTTANGNSELNVPGCIVGTAYIEQACKVTVGGDATVGGSNDFVTSGKDVWKGTKTYSKYYAGEGSVIVKDGWSVNSLGLFPSARTVARNDNGYNNRLRRTIVDDGTGKPVILEQLSETVYATPPQKFIPNAVGSVDDKYYWVQFEKNVSSKAALYSGVPTTAAQTPITAPAIKVIMERLGNRVKLKINLDASNYAAGGSNPVVIGFTGIYKPIIATSSDYALGAYGPVRPIMVSTKTFTVTDSTSVSRTFRIEPVAHQAGVFTDGAGVNNYYFVLLTQHHTSDTNRLLWSDFTGSLCQIEIEYDTNDTITSSSVF
ncbi:hypothetical protein [Klebsiella phage phiKp_32]|nr:hypothetical protein [Klebsiella phage phiKp_32]